MNDVRYLFVLPLIDLNLIPDLNLLLHDESDSASSPAFITGSIASANFTLFTVIGPISNCYTCGFPGCVVVLICPWIHAFFFFHFLLNMPVYATIGFSPPSNLASGRFQYSSRVKQVNNLLSYRLIHPQVAIFLRLSHHFLCSFPLTFGLPTITVEESPSSFC